MSAKTTTKKLRRKVRYPGIVTDAEALNVTHQHLRLVLDGKRASKPLIARYRALKEQQQKEENALRGEQKEVA